MLKNYIKIAWRNMLKNKFHTVINVMGLSAGIAFTLLIAAYVWNELQVDKNLKNVNRQYIIQSNWKNSNESFPISTPGQLAKALKELYPGLVANYYRFDGISSNVSKDGKGFRENLQIGDSTILNMFGFTLLHGDARTALNNPFSVIITKDKAIKYFGKTDVVGKTISIESFSGSKYDFMITGVLNTIPKNSVTSLIEDSPGGFYVSTENLDFFGRNMAWGNTHIIGYIELQKGVDPSQINAPMAYLIKQNSPSQISANLTTSLIPLKKYYLSANNRLAQKMIYALSAIALFILTMAVINFINMSVSLSVARMREIGIRKVLGGLKRQLIIQFLTESTIIVFFATVVAFTIYGATRNIFSTILGKDIPALNQFPLYLLLIPCLFIGLIGFIGSIYPAFVLSSLKSVESLKGKFTSAKDYVMLRKSLIAFQFITATIAFTGAIVISKQITLFLSKALGYNKDYIISAQVPRNWTREGVDKMLTIRDEFASMPGVQKVALSFEIPDGNSANNVPLVKFGTDSTQAVSASILENDEHFLSLYQIPLLSGTPFEGHRLDSLKVIINDAAVKALGWKDAQQAIGAQVKIPGNPEIYTIKGVTNDFHFKSMQTKVSPIIMFCLQYDFIYRYLSFKIGPGNIPSTIKSLQEKWSSLMPGTSFEYNFMDDTLASLYKSELQLKKASYTATFLALIIVLLGIIGLLSLSIQKRAKEIGVRKVLGSSVAGIIKIFVKEFLAVILIGGLVACPLAYLIMSSWLQEYAYRVQIGAMPFIISILCLGLITTLLICLQTIKAALTNPVKSLRTE